MSIRWTLNILLATVLVGCGAPSPDVSEPDTGPAFQVEAPPGPPKALAIDSGGEHTCALISGGRVRCWGYGWYGQLGLGEDLPTTLAPRDDEDSITPPKPWTENLGDDELPCTVDDIYLDGEVIQIAAGGWHNCVLLSGGRVRCWGDGRYGKLGYGNTDNIGDDESPASAGDVDIGGKVVQLSASVNHTCAVLEAGTVRCWGKGTYGALGYGNTDDIGDDETPASAGDVNIGGKAIQVTTGGKHTCILLESGVARCWGHGPHGQLGVPGVETVGDDEHPADHAVLVLPAPATFIDAGHTHTCALLVGGAVTCWGGNGWGSLGIGSEDHVGDDEAADGGGPVQVEEMVLHLDVDGAHSCVVLHGGTARCWGKNDNGELGLGHTDHIGDDELPSAAPALAFDEPIIQVSPGVHHTCALLQSGAVHCWGKNATGQLGLGHTDDIGDDESPTSVAPVKLLPVDC